MSITTVGITLALVTGVLGAWLYIEQTQSVTAESTTIRAQVACQQAQQQAQQARLMGEPATAVSAAQKAATTACDTYAQAQKAEARQATEQQSTLDRIKSALLDTK